MNEHPWYLLAGIAIGILVGPIAVYYALLARRAWHSGTTARERAQIAAVDRRNAQAAEARDARFYAGAEAVLSHPADAGPLDDDGKWAL